MKPWLLGKGRAGLYILVSQATLNTVIHLAKAHFDIECLPPGTRAYVHFSAVKVCTRARTCVYVSCVCVCDSLIMGCTMKKEKNRTHPFKFFSCVYM